jgi:hypothetical protein
MGRCWPVALTRLCAAIAVVYSVRGELARTREMEAKLPAPSRRPSAPRSPSPFALPATRVVPREHLQRPPGYAGGVA